MNDDIKPLETVFTRGKVKYIQVCREGNVAVYRRQSPHWTDWETIIIRSQEASSRVLDGVTVDSEAKELYPTDNAWGTMGWTYQSEEWAREKFEEVRSRPKKQVGDDVAGVLEEDKGQDSGSDLEGLES